MTCLGGPWPLTPSFAQLHSPTQTVPTQTCGRACQVLRLAPSAPPPTASLDVHHTTSSVPCRSLGKGDPAIAPAKRPGLSLRGLKGAPPQSRPWALESAVAVGGRPLPNSPGSPGPALSGCSQAGSRSEPPASYTVVRPIAASFLPAARGRTPNPGPVSTCPSVCSPVCR